MNKIKGLHGLGAIRVICSVMLRCIVVMNCGILHVGFINVPKKYISFFILKFI